MSERPPRDRAIWVMALLVLLTLGVSLGALVWLEHRFEEAEASEIERTRASFEGAGALGDPLRRTAIRYTRLRAMVESSSGGTFIREIWVSKELDDGSEHLLWPLTEWHRRPDWRSHIAGWQRHPLRGADGEVIGHLHFDVDRSWLATTQVATRTVAGLMVAVLALLLSRLFRTSRRLEATTDALIARQRELIHIERLALAGQLSANVLHDIKKPVLNIRHGIDDLAEALAEFSGPRRALEEMRDQTELFQGILRETSLERFVQARDEDEEFLDLNAVMRQSAGLVRYERRDVDLAFDFNGGIPAVHASRHRLVQVFSNLILNAYQAMDGKGRLVLRTRPAEEEVVAEVMDTGPGLDPQVRDRLFEPFVTTKPPEVGTGLGLMICRMIVEALGGEIEAENRDSGGAVFRVRLPPGERQ